MIYLGADHRGYELKEKAKQWLAELGYEFEDCGAAELSPEDDYPDFAAAVARKIEDDPQSKGILFCGSGIGVCIAANKIRGIRAGTAASPGQVKASVSDEDLNILCLSADYAPNADFVDTDIAAKDTIRTFLETKFSGEERHMRRLDKIKALEG